MDKDVRLTVRKIFEDLRKNQPAVRSRKSDRINVDRILDELQERNLQRDKYPID